MADVDVLVVGAGPTGLTMAGELLYHGASVRLIDAAPDRAHTSRAFGVQARTLELFHARGLAAPLIARGHRNLHMVRHIVGRKPASLVLEDIGVRGTRFPFMLMVSQVDTEDILLAHFESLGGVVERCTELTGYEQDALGVTATLRRPDGTQEPLRAAYLIGADGAHSTVRKLAGIAFEGGTYETSWVLADLDVDGPLEPGALHFFISPTGLIAFVALRRPAPWRMMAVDLDTTVTDRAAPTLAELQQMVNRRIDQPLHLYGDVWRSRFRVHHRMAERFRAGRVFLTGDAGHIHSPAGGQGMNTGIQDAWNLAWKLALVMHGQAPAELLDSYEAERIPVAQFLLRFTDRLFSLMVSSQPLARAWRSLLVPTATAMAARSRAARRLIFRTVSQLEIAYPDSPIVAQHSRRLRPRAGQRLPDIELPDGQGWLHDQLTPRHNLLICQPPTDPTRLEQLQHRYHGLLDVRWLPPGTWGGGVVLVRPDGHIAFRGSVHGTELHDYLQRWLRPTTVGQPQPSSPPN
ncbi:MAG: FAD-dependent monooxygenase [Pseudonocardiales bacterium]|nr:FAD-dependent monooxygenase [Pseudonocardiales bacterium]